MIIYLIKGGSYSYDKYVATKENPSIDVPDNVAEYLLSTGYFSANSLVQKNKPNTPTITTKDVPTTGEKQSEEGQSAVNVENMSTKEINALAKELGVEFAEGDKKPEKIAKLNEFLNKKEE